MNENEILSIVKNIGTRKFGCISKSKIDEKDLLKIANHLKENEIMSIDNLFSALTDFKFNSDCDWNVGSIMQHFNYNNIIECLKKIPEYKKGFLYSSIGLTWALGECPYKNEVVIDFLYEILNYSTDSESWWRSAFALEKMTGKNAINNLKRSLKNKEIPSLEDCFENLNDKKSVVGILLNSNSMVIKKEIYPKLKDKFDRVTNELEQLNIIWLFGRLRLYDEEIYSKILELLHKSDNYEIIYYIFQSMIDDPKQLFIEEFYKCLSLEDPLIKKMALAGLAEYGTDIDVKKLYELLEKETNPNVIAALTKAIYKIKNSQLKENTQFIKKYMVNENGLIGDDSDKWYADASIYNFFSESEDVENMCFQLVFNRILQSKLRIENPIDLATGTGKAAKYILNNVNYDGTLYAIDFSQQMLDYFSRTIDRQKYYVKNVELVNSTIENFILPENSKSSLITSSFGFPSKIADRERTYRELENVYNLLDDDGIFVTIGWDETFNDELNTMWYKYIPDSIKANTFEEWRITREQSIESPRNCGLTWYKTNLKIPLIYDTLEEAINVMGHLFGRDAAIEVLKNKQNIWWMSMGITWDDKKSLSRILDKRR